MILLFGFLVNTLLFFSLAHFMGRKTFIPYIESMTRLNNFRSLSFWKLMPRIFLGQFLKISMEPLHSEEIKGFGLRERQFFFATNTIGLMVAMGLSLLVLIIPGFFYWGEYLAKTAMGLQDFNWIFYLSTNYLFGSVGAFVCAMLLRCLIPQTGCLFWVALQGVLSGVMSLGFAWGVILGDIFFGFVRQSFMEKKDKEFLIRNLISTCLVLTFLLASPWIQNFVEVFRWEFGGSENRLIQLLLMFLFWWMVDLIANMTFFHFRFQSLKGSMRA